MKYTFNRLMRLLLCVVALCALLSVTAAAAEIVDSGSCGENAVWAVYSDKSLVISGTGAVTEIPWRDTYSALHSVVVEEGITDLPESAFAGMQKVTTVTLPDSLPAIPMGCFSNNTSLESIRLPNGLRTIGESAFTNCDALTSFVIPDTVADKTPIAWIFNGCDNLRELTIGKNIENIVVDHEFCFNGLVSLENIYVVPENSRYTSVDGVLFTKDMKTLIKYPAGRKGSYTIPDGVETINALAFWRAQYVTEINIPASVKTITENTIGSFLVFHCTALESIHVDEKNTAFSSHDGILYNKAKTNVMCCGPARQGFVALPEGVWEVGTRAFMNCAGITGIAMPYSVELVGFEAFGNCNCLTDVYYYGSQQQWHSIAVEQFNDSFDAAAKHYNAAVPGTWNIQYHLNGGKVDGTNPAAYFNYDDEIPLITPAREGYHFDGWFADAGFTTPVVAPYISKGYSYGDLELHAKWTSDSDGHTHVFDGDKKCFCGAFGGDLAGDVHWVLDTDGTMTVYGTGHMEHEYIGEGEVRVNWPDNKDKISKIVIEEGITGIGFQVLTGFHGLAEISIPESVTSIDFGAFGGCTSLTGVTLPSGLTHVGNWAFANCERLETVYFTGDAPVIAEECFGGVTAAVYYPANNHTWTPDMMLDYGGSLTWIPYMPASDVAPGDANGDGTINNVDAMLVLQHAVGLLDESRLHLAACDVNGDGNINNVDAMLILQYAVGLIKQFQ